MKPPGERWTRFQLELVGTTNLMALRRGGGEEDGDVGGHVSKLSVNKCLRNNLP